MGIKVLLPEDKCGDEMSRLAGPCQLHRGHWSAHRAKSKRWWGYVRGEWGDPVAGEPCPLTPADTTRKQNRDLSILYWIWVAYLAFTAALLGWQVFT